MRGFVQLTPEGRIVWFEAHQGTGSFRGTLEADETIADADRWHWSVRYRELATVRGMEPGVYRVRGSNAPGESWRSIGKRVDPVREAARLRERAARQNTEARTRTPGIEGFQHMENMATARLHEVQSESRMLADFLDTLA